MRYPEVMLWEKTRDDLYRKWLEVKKPSAATFDGVDADGYFYVHDVDSGRVVHVSHQRRLGYYAHGVTQRLNNLAREYCIEGLELVPSDVIVDVGAHSGELGLWAEKFGSQYLAIEPDPAAFGALSRNLPQAKKVNCAAGKQAGRLPFYLATSTGDSSFEIAERRKPIEVKVETLDVLVNSFFPGGNIAILKIEAEGFEPEVLEGAREVLKRTELVTVDAGEERGGASTAPECLNLLFGAGFILKNVFLKRGIFLMARA
jgi:FkbM family methyltransferase